MAVLSVGVGKTYSTIAAAIAAAKNGDTINVDAGTYVNDWVSINKNITLQGVGGRVDIVSSGLIPNGKAIFVTNGDITINNFSFSGAVVTDRNGAGIKQESGNLVLNNCGFFNNEMGVLTGNIGTLTVNNSEFAYNGVKSGSGAIGHNLYAGRLQNLTINDSYFHDAKTGHEIKSRALNTKIENSRIYDLNAIASYSIDLPNGGNALIQNNVIEQGPLSPNSTIVIYGEERNLNPGTNFLISGNTIINHKVGSPVAVWNATTATAQITGNKFFGLTSSQIAYGRNVQTGNQFLTTDPLLDKTHPWSSSFTIGLLSDTGSSAIDKITSNPAVAGTGQASTLVTIKEGTTILGTTTADSTGAWNFTPTGLADGAHTISAAQTDLAGNTGTATLSFTLDKTAPAVSMALVSNSGSSASDRITSNPALKGTGQANTVVTVKKGGTTLGTTTADSTGAWSFTPTGLADGAHTISAAQTDLAGNTGTATLSFTLDQTAPAALRGTEGNDVLTGTLTGLNVVYGLGGNDLISMQYGSATTEIYGGDGDDTIKGSAWGNDYIDGGPGNDIVSSAWGDDTILGGDGNDYIDAYVGNDIIYGGSGNDTIYANWGDDTIFDELGVNWIDGGNGNDTAFFAGNYIDYSLTSANGVTTVTGTEGTSSLKNIESIRFEDGSYDALAGLFLR